MSSDLIEATAEQKAEKEITAAEVARLSQHRYKSVLWVLAGIAAVSIAAAIAAGAVALTSRHTANVLKSGFCAQANYFDGQVYDEQIKSHPDEARIVRLGQLSTVMRNSVSCTAFVPPPKRTP